MRFFLRKQIETIEHLISFISEQYPDISEEEKFFLINVSLGSPDVIKEIKNKKIYKFYESLLEDLISSKSFLNLNENNIHFNKFKRPGVFTKFT